MLGPVPASRFSSRSGLRKGSFRLLPHDGQQSMTFLLIPLIWLAVTTLVVAVCQVAASTRQDL